jgi:hypothetical protein
MHICSNIFPQSAQSNRGFRIQPFFSTMKKNTHKLSAPAYARASRPTKHRILDARFLTLAASLACLPAFQGALLIGAPPANRMAMSLSTTPLALETAMLFSVSNNT